VVELILKDIEDEHIRENFFRIRNFLLNQPIFDGDFKIFDITIDKKVEIFPVKHGLTFIPADIIPLSSSGNFNYYFRFQEFDRDNMYVTTDGPVRIRFLAGKLKDQIKSKGSTNPFSLVAPGDTIKPASPGFVYGAVGAKSDGFWLTSEGIPSNVVGIPVLFGDGIVIQAAVGTEAESDYTLGIYQHEGAGLNLTLIGTFDIVSGGAKRVAFNFPIAYSSNNIQLACRLMSGNTLNLKVSLILRGSSI
jgi:hypothetical protein